jgi:hypothetical protein
MSSEPVCQVAHSWVDVGSFHAHLVVRFVIFTASVQNILVTPSYICVCACMCTCRGLHKFSVSLGVTSKL